MIRTWDRRNWRQVEQAGDCVPVIGVPAQRQWCRRAAFIGNVDAIMRCAQGFEIRQVAKNVQGAAKRRIFYLEKISGDGGWRTPPLFGWMALPPRQERRFPPAARGPALPPPLSRRPPQKRRPPSS